MKNHENTNKSFLLPATACNSMFKRISRRRPSLNNWALSKLSTKDSIQVQISKICIADHCSPAAPPWQIPRLLFALPTWHCGIKIPLTDRNLSLTHMECDHLYTWVTCTHQGCAHRLRSLVHISLRKTREKWPHGFIHLGLMGGHGEGGHEIYGEALDSGTLGHWFGDMGTKRRRRQLPTRKSDLSRAPATGRNFMYHNFFMQFPSVRVFDFCKMSECSTLLSVPRKRLLC